MTGRQSRARNRATPQKAAQKVPQKATPTVTGPDRARLWHLPGLLAVLWSFTRSTPWLPVTRTRLTDLRLMAGMIRRGEVRMLRDGALPVAFLARDNAYVKALYVLPAWRAQGAGSRLLTEAQENAAALELFTHVRNTAARRFYARAGFIEAEGSLENDESVPDLRMVWRRPGPGSGARATATERAGR